MITFLLSICAQRRSFPRLAPKASISKTELETFTWQALFKEKLWNVFSNMEKFAMWQILIKACIPPPIPPHAARWLLCFVSVSNACRYKHRWKIQIQDLLSYRAGDWTFSNTTTGEKMYSIFSIFSSRFQTWDKFLFNTSLKPWAQKLVARQRLTARTRSEDCLKVNFTLRGNVAWIQING